jgi:protein-tyrosine phosphatase
VITHPERLTWVEDHYPVFLDLVRQGAWMQTTAASFTGVFGARAKYWAERFLEEGMTHILATDAHSNGRRSPVMSKARAIAERDARAGRGELLVRGRQECMLRNDLPSAVPPLPSDSEESSRTQQRRLAAEAVRRPADQRARARQSA